MAITVTLQTKAGVFLFWRWKNCPTAFNTGVRAEEEEAKDYAKVRWRKQRKSWIYYVSITGHLRGNEMRGGKRRRKLEESNNLMSCLVCFYHLISREGTKYSCQTNTAAFFLVNTNIIQLFFSKLSSDTGPNVVNHHYCTSEKKEAQARWSVTLEGLEKITILWQRKR